MFTKCDNNAVFTNVGKKNNHTTFDKTYYTKLYLIWDIYVYIYIIILHIVQVKDASVFE